MQAEKADPAYLWDMLDAARAVQQFVEGKTLSNFREDRMLRGAVERHMEIIGEAAGRVSREFRAKHPEIPWRGIIGQRNVLIHHYGEINQELVWRVAALHVPELIRMLEALLPEPPDAPG